MSTPAVLTTEIIVMRRKRSGKFAHISFFVCEVLTGVTPKMISHRARGMRAILWEGAPVYTSKRKSRTDWHQREARLAAVDWARMVARDRKIQFREPL